MVQILVVLIFDQLTVNHPRYQLSFEIYIIFEFTVIISLSEMCTRFDGLPCRFSGKFASVAGRDCFEIPRNEVCRKAYTRFFNK